MVSHELSTIATTKKCVNVTFSFALLLEKGSRRTTPRLVIDNVLDGCRHSAIGTVLIARVVLCVVVGLTHERIPPAHLDDRFIRHRHVQTVQIHKHAPMHVRDQSVAIVQSSAENSDEVATRFVVAVSVRPFDDEDLGGDDAAYNAASEVDQIEIDLIELSSSGPAGGRPSRIGLVVAGKENLAQYDGERFPGQLLLVRELPEVDAGAVAVDESAVLADHLERNVGGGVHEAEGTWIWNKQETVTRTGIVSGYYCRCRCRYRDNSGWFLELLIMIIVQIPVQIDAVQVL